MLTNTGCIALYQPNNDQYYIHDHTLKDNTMTIQIRTDKIPFNVKLETLYSSVILKKNFKIQFHKTIDLINDNPKFTH